MNVVIRRSEGGVFYYNQLDLFLFLDKNTIKEALLLTNKKHMKKAILKIFFVFFLVSSFAFIITDYVEAVHPPIDFTVTVEEDFTVSIFEDAEYTTQAMSDLIILSGEKKTRNPSPGTYWYKAVSEENNTYECTGGNFSASLTAEIDERFVTFEVKDNEGNPAEGELIYIFKEEDMPGQGGPPTEEFGSGYTDEDGKFVFEEFETDQVYWYVIAPREKYETKEGKFEITSDDNFKIQTEGHFIINSIEEVEITMKKDANIVRSIRWDGEDTAADKHPSEPAFYQFFHEDGNQAKFQFKIGKFDSDISDTKRVTADFEAFGGPTSVEPNLFEDNYYYFLWDWYEEGEDVEQEGPFNTVPIYHWVRADSASDWQIYNIGTLLASNFNPREHIPILGGEESETTDWSGVHEEHGVSDDFDFTAAENLVFHNVGVGKLEIAGPVNLTERKTAESLAGLAFHLNIEEGRMSLDTERLFAFAGEYGAATLTMYDIDFENAPNIVYTDQDGNQQEVVTAGEIVDSDVISSFDWNENEGIIEFSVTGWSAYEAVESTPAPTPSRRGGGALAPRMKPEVPEKEIPEEAIEKVEAYRERAENIAQEAKRMRDNKDSLDGMKETVMTLLEMDEMEPQRETLLAMLKRIEELKERVEENLKEKEEKLEEVRSKKALAEKSEKIEEIKEMIRDFLDSDEAEEDEKESFLEALEAAERLQGRIQKILLR